MDEEQRKAWEDWVDGLAKIEDRPQVAFPPSLILAADAELTRLRARVAKLERVVEAAKECDRQYFYNNDDDYDDVAYDCAMKKLRAALSAKEKAEGALCSAKEALKVVGFQDSSPCPHELAEKRLRDQGADDKRVFFYERQFYVLSNFSAFSLEWNGKRFDTSEAAYHWEKFPNHSDIRQQIWDAPSAHAALKIAEKYKDYRRTDWENVRVDIMRDILRAKAQQHEYVRQKLLETGDRELIENSWRDGFWGWHPNGEGRNMLGKLWMEIRAELRRRAGEAG